jgi:hypothetical protein
MDLAARHSGRCMKDKERLTALDEVCGAGRRRAIYNQ